MSCPEGPGSVDLDRLVEGLSEEQAAELVRRLSSRGAGGRTSDGVHVRVHSDSELLAVDATGARHVIAAGEVEVFLPAPVDGGAAPRSPSEGPTALGPFPMTPVAFLWLRLEPAESEAVEVEIDTGPMRASARWGRATFLGGGQGKGAAFAVLARAAQRVRLEPGEAYVLTALGFAPALDLERVFTPGLLRPGSDA